MTVEEQKEFTKELISPDEISDTELSVVLSLGADLILNRLYPFGYSEDSTVPARYHKLQCQIAVELWSKKGAEGQVAHTENGISRGWESAGVSSSLLRQVTPMVGSVISSA